MGEKGYNNIKPDRMNKNSSTNRLFDGRCILLHFRLLVCLLFVCLLFVVLFLLLLFMLRLRLGVLGLLLLGMLLGCRSLPC
jgi:hypothetical protein